MLSPAPEGYDQEAVETWIRNNADGVTPPLRWTRLLGGHSNLTYRIDDARGRSAVIRRPPRGELLPKAHDMSREWSLISSLGPTPVPVPEAIAFCEDPDVTGKWFYIMGRVEGRPLYTSADTEAWVPEESRRKLAFSFFDVLGDLHAVDPDEVGLGDLGKRDSYVRRQLRTWYRSWTASVEPAEFDDPRAHALQEYFLENRPEQGPARVVHGDYGLHNCLVGADSTIAAVVDWEISTLGDPLADLAYSLNQWPEAKNVPPKAPGGATAVAGFPPREELAQRYSERTGRGLSRLDYYLGFNRWKSAAIIHGVYARYMEGKKSTAGIDLDEMRKSILARLDEAEAAVNRL
ncbi:MAG: phosphotransferase family protein [Acidobacteriota bacterium]|nr:phosphotransferase family protein [Acidobacteriota bacterium]